MLPNEDLFSKSVTENIPPNGNLPPQPYVQKTDPPIPSSTPSYRTLEGSRNTPKHQPLP
ncbi:hypothetical protein M407DRAFT_31982 [Tulasnella calospora MUT 4182]|uniref:Uncharacterized protein n=1 Tax=Tulasnella calospora MUT 4182 TaxID=1051891 RepID=A0A0C3KAD6_9AGAM|nr:hypothetical protein M407DRAFT_31982 [Tulasnella calospora MUT 4182]